MVSLNSWQLCTCDVQPRQKESIPWRPLAAQAHEFPAMSLWKDPMAGQSTHISQWSWQNQNLSITLWVQDDHGHHKTEPTWNHFERYEHTVMPACSSIRLSPPFCCFQEALNSFALGIVAASVRQCWIIENHFRKKQENHGVTLNYRENKEK